VGIAALVLGSFYVPYVLQPGFPAVKEYLLSRIASGAGMQTFPATLALLDLYLPPFYLAVAIPLLACGIAHVLARGRTVTGVIVLFWFLSVFSVYMLLGGDPRSHVYNYFVPGLILVALGIAGIVEPIRNLPVRRVLQIGAWALIVSSGAMTYYMLVDHTVEHPWTSKRILGHPLPNLETGIVEGVFGFPYQRGLDQVGRMFQSGQLRGTFDSNERDVMADYYFHSRRGSPPDYYVYVDRPLSLSRDLPPYVKIGYKRVAEIAVRGTRTIEVYERQGRRQ
jgi:hypothetical protein